MKFRTPEEVIERANSTPYGLAAAVWTNDIKTAQKVSRGLKSGTVWVRLAVLCFRLLLMRVSAGELLQRAGPRHAVRWLQGQRYRSRAGQLRSAGVH